MVRNKQNTYIKKAFFAATKINKDGIIVSNKQNFYINVSSI